jgi:hypothetical protein
MFNQEANVNVQRVAQLLIKFTVKNLTIRKINAVSRENQYPKFRMLIEIVRHAHATPL